MSCIEEKGAGFIDIHCSAQSAALFVDLSKNIFYLPIHQKESYVESVESPLKCWDSTFLTCPSFKSQIISNMKYAFFLEK